MVEHENHNIAPNTASTLRCLRCGPNPTSVELLEYVRSQLDLQVVSGCLTVECQHGRTDARYAVRDVLLALFRARNQTIDAKEMARSVCAELLGQMQ